MDLSSEFASRRSPLFESNKEFPARQSKLIWPLFPSISANQVGGPISISAPGNHTRKESIYGYEKTTKTGLRGAGFIRY